MDHSDQYMKGRMLAQVFELLLDDEHLGEGSYLRWEVNNHLLAYGVDELAQVGLGEAHLLLALSDDSAYGKAKKAFQAALDANPKSLRANQILKGLVDVELGQGNASAAKKHADALVAAGRSARSS